MGYQWMDKPSYLDVNASEKEREIDRQTDRQTNKSEEKVDIQKEN